MSILYVKASPFGEGSDSNKLGEALVARLGGQADVVDLNQEEVPFLTKDAILYSWGVLNDETASAEAKAVNAKRVSNIEKLKSVDTLVISYPVWNFSIPAVLKAWLDLVVYMGKTFKYGENGPEGLIGNIQKVYIIESVGSLPGMIPDFFGAYLTGALSFLGMKNIERITLGGTNTGSDEEKAARRAEAMDKINALAI
jgi:FMN-dependent NADH-azoreductase